jgi:threonine aldolase
MTDKELKSGCSIDLSFPFYPHETAGERLRKVADYMDREGLGSEKYLGGPSVRMLEDRSADLVGMPEAVWFPTGTMAQGVAARLYAESTGRNDILLHPTSHLELHEDHSYAYVHGLNARMIGAWPRPLVADDLQADAACAIVELPQRHNGGALPDWDELTAIKHRAIELELPLHMDGARLWATRPFYGGRSYADISDGFSSVYVSFYKEIGALAGAVLAGESGFCEEARAWRDRMGGLTVSPWPAVPDTLRLLDHRLPLMPDFVEQAGRLAASLATIDDLVVTPEPPHVNMMHVSLACPVETAQAARDEAARQTGVWLCGGFWALERDDQCAMELVIGERALGYDHQRIVDAVTIMMQTIRADQKA